MEYFFKCIICFEFSPFLSQFGSQLHPHFSNYPVLLALDSPHTPRPWRPQIGSGDPWETYAFFKPYALDWLPWFQAPEVLEMRRSKSSPAESSPLPRSDEPIMSLQCEPAKLSSWQRQDLKPRPSGCRTSWIFLMEKQILSHIVHKYFLGNPWKHTLSNSIRIKNT